MCGDRRFLLLGFRCDLGDSLQIGTFIEVGEIAPSHQDDAQIQAIANTNDLLTRVTYDPFLESAHAPPGLQSLLDLFHPRHYSVWSSLSREILQDTVFYGLFNSIEQSVLTLFKATTGGDDWSVAYDALTTVGPVAGLCFLLFIAFVQFAVVNIITCIFVDSAMAVLKPDAEAAARETFRSELHLAKELRKICRAVNGDGSGQLSQQDFEAGLEQNRHLPLLLKGLGFKRHNFKEFFEGMASGSDQRVDIEGFVNGCILLRGEASNFDVLKLRTELDNLDSKMRTTLELLRRKL